ncbi:MAG TPA: sigma-70 family RNA polymerase sigma factor [Nannocystaceae bacterium]|nr:sigma-70 family RNA polymerase sigma factor [Nannocystaceae bacterium]
MPTDLELLDAWKAGKVEAGEELFDRYFDALYRFFGNKVTDGIDDLVQQTMEALQKSRDTFRGDSSFRTFVFGAARNILFKYFERRTRDAQRFDHETMSVADLGESPSRVIAARADQRVLALALRRIPLDYQIALELYFWEDMTGPQLAAALGLKEPAVRSRLRRALELLRKVIAEVAASPEETQSVSLDLDKWASSLRDTDD